MKCDQRPQRAGWAPGGYYKHCLKCGCAYSGDKRSSICADCAYAMQPYIPPTAEDSIKQLEEEVSDLKGINAAMTMDAAMYEDRGARIKQLEDAIRKTLDENRHLADGDDCTLRDLKKALPTWK